MSNRGRQAGGESQGDRLDSWKEIARYLGRSERTVHRWEVREGLPVHRLQHEKRGSVYSYGQELDAWWESKKLSIEPEPPKPSVPETGETALRRYTWDAGIPLKRRLWLAVAVVLLAAGLGVWFMVRSAWIRPTSFSSIAVIPFDNLSHNPAEEWFSDGMTETLITELSRIRSFKVISRTSVMQYKSTRKSVRQIGNELGVDAVVEGSALRLGNRVRITAQLIATSTDGHLWGNYFDGDLSDVFSLHREVARAIAHEVGFTLTVGDRQRLARSAPPVNPRAMASYLKGVYQLNRMALPQALDLAQEAIRLDPRLAPAHELLGAVLVLEHDTRMKPYVLVEARAELQRALELDPDRGMSLSWLGWTYLIGDHDWIRAEANMRRGFEIDRRTGNEYGFLLAGQGRYDAAIRVGDQALLSDPANPLVITDAARFYHFARRYDEAVRLFRKALELSPDFAYARMRLPISLLLAGRQDEAFEAWLSWLSLPGVAGSLDRKTEFQEVYRMGGWPAVWRNYLEHPLGNVRTNYTRLAPVFLHRNQEALDMLEELERNVDAWMIQLEDPVFDPLRREPRFRALLKRVGYPPSMSQ